MAHITTDVRQHRISVRVQGAPDVKNRYGNGHIAPTSIHFIYWMDGSQPEVSARLFGLWVRDNGERTDQVCEQDYHAPHHKWPDWLTSLVRKHQPKP